MPHPSLDFNNIYRLPRRLQKIALRASDDGPDSTLEDLLGIPRNEYANAYQKDPVPPASFLPVYYKILGRYLHPPKSVVTPQQWFAFAASPLPVLNVMDMMLEHSLIPSEVVPDLWPRIWHCMTLQIPYIRQLGAEGLDICSVHFSIIRRLSLGDDRTEPEAIIASTPGIRGHISRLWAYFLHHKELWESTGRDADANISRILPSFFGDDIHTDIIEGAGGTFLDLASLVIKHVNMITSQISTTGASEAHVHFIDFLHGGLAQSFNISRAMHTLDLITPLKTLANALWPIRSNPRVATQLLEGCLPLVSRELNTYPGPRKEIDTRLFILLARCSIAEVGQEGNAITDILGGILPGTLTFYSVLHRVERAFRALDELHLTSSLHRSHFSSYWTGLRQLADERLAIKSRFDEGHNFDKFCDNIDCIRMATQTDFRRCSRCRSVSYCSSFCQQEDWTLGEHRSVCKRPQPTDSDLQEPYLPPRERAFLRYLVHDDYLTNKHEIFERCVDFYTEYGRGESCYTQFNYIDGALSIDVLPMSELASSMSQEDMTRGEHEIARLARSAGKMQLHIVVIANAGFGRFLCCPLRTRDAKIRDCLIQLGESRHTTNLTEAQHQERIEWLVSQASGAVEVHQPIYSWVIPKTA